MFKRMVVELNEKFHKAIKLKAAKEGLTLREVQLNLLEMWVKGKVKL